MRRSLKQRSILSKQTVQKRNKKKQRGFLLGLIHRVVPAFLKGLVLIVAFLGISLSLLYCYHYLRTSSLTRLEKVEIVGVNDTIKKELIDLCDFKAGSNLLFLDLKELRQKMGTHPWVSSIRFKRRFPHTLFVEVQPRRPVALVVMDDIYYMDEQCNIFKRIDSCDDMDYPIITGITKEDAELGAHLTQTSQILQVLAAQKKPWSLDNLSEIHLKDRSISLYFKNLSAQINVRGDNLIEKMECLKKVTKHLKATGRIHLVTGIDLNSVEGAVVSFRKG